MPTIKKRLINGKLMTRVTLGPYTSERSLNKTLKKLENNNIEYYIINE
jgi:cell division protein FtsN